MQIMKLATVAVLLLAVTSPLRTTTAGAEEAPSESELEPIDPPSTVAEARSRARLLHEVAHGALQVVHRDFFDEENVHAIPSASLEDVFKEMSRSYRVEIAWLNVNTDIVNIDHQPESPFEKEAAKGLAAGKPYVEATDANRYRFAGPIRLASQCLKCHLKHRTSTADRTAGLVISMPYFGD